MAESCIQAVNFFDLPLHTGTFNDIAEWIINSCVDPERVSPTILSHINIHNYYQLIKDCQLKSDLSKNAALIFDGIGLKVAAFIAGSGWLPDLNGTDLFPLIMEKGSERRLKIYCLGTDADILARAVKKIHERFPRIIIAGYRNGYFRPEEEQQVVEEINSHSPDMLIIGMGFITQEKFALRYRERLHAKVIWNVGGLFDIVSGEKPRTPLFMRKLRLEWLFRLFLEPHKRWERNFVSAPLFFAFFLIYRVKKLLKISPDFSETT